MKSTDQPYIALKLHNSVNGKSIDCCALIDTGASSCCIPTSMVRALSLPQTGIVRISTAAGVLDVPQYVVQVVIEKQVFDCVVVEVSDPTPMLIGWDVIQKSNLLHTISAKIPGQVVHFLTAIPTLKKQMVLVLGQDTTHIDRLMLIKNQLNVRGYTGIIVKDQSDVDIQSIEEKVNMLASLCRFVICDNSFPSGHIDELKICSLNRFVTAVIQEKGRGATWMQSDYPVDYSFITVIEYSDIRGIPDVVEQAIEWAKNKLDERKSFFDKIYRWRTPGTGAI
ncbi:MAG: retropepsin-like aspartic protease [Proteobacteria bacterium]|nr:retropepsin-like aspartic protease [Pseudomonadota bacterium]